MLDEVRALCDNVVIISHGRAVAYGNTADICRQAHCPTLDDAFLALTGREVILHEPAFVVARKEIRDHARDPRSLVSSAMMALMGPGVVLLVSLSDRAPGQDGARVLLGMLSVFALVSAFAGAIDIAMDSTAGERERRSLLPLLLNPIPRSDVIVGKWIAVTAFALVALALNAAAVAVLAWAAPFLLVTRAQQIVVWVVLGLVPLAALGAAVNLFVARCAARPRRRIPRSGSSRFCRCWWACSSCFSLHGPAARGSCFRSSDNRRSSQCGAVGAQCAGRDSRARHAGGVGPPARRRKPGAESG